ncbi:unnamed protein product [Musa acuminata subsp. malaccensis]|uniref:(wild Malaysian banana) hypothetical protein n=1 Tax=Musa acuminata subsp. malaccensis TaxID=214687 RepID=A0A804KAE0_MUSAM|nr:unnamed protein product [Musa acuminata subsp. malaccensis]
MATGRGSPASAPGRGAAKTLPSCSSLPSCRMPTASSVTRYKSESGGGLGGPPRSISSREDVLRRLIRRSAYLKYVEARLGDRTLFADEILRDGFCLNLIDTPICPLKVVTNLQESVWDADIVVNGWPSTEMREVFEEIGWYRKERISAPIIISLAKGIEASLHQVPRVITPTQIISHAITIEKILYVGGPNIASEIYSKEYANAPICGAEKWRKLLTKFLRQPHFIVWDNCDLITHEAMGGLKNVYAIGAGMIVALTNESAMSKSVYFAHCTSEMILITHLLAEGPEKISGPLLADTYVTLLKGRNAWYGQMLAKGEITLEMGFSIKGKGTIQGVFAVHALYDLLSQPNLCFGSGKKEGCLILLRCASFWEHFTIYIDKKMDDYSIFPCLQGTFDRCYPSSTERQTMNDPCDRIELALSHALYKLSLLGQP